MSKEKLKRCSLLLTEKQIQYLKAKRRMSVYVRALLEREMAKEIQIVLSSVERRFVEAILLYFEKYADKRHDELFKREDKDAVYYLTPYRYEIFNVGNRDIKDVVEWLRHNEREEEANVLESLDKEVIDRILSFAKREWEGQYPEAWRMKYGELRLGELILEFEFRRFRGIHEFRISDILEDTGVSYGIAYYKLKPILQNLGFDFVDSRRKA